jgi:hypothetical protein
MGHPSAASAARTLEHALAYRTRGWALLPLRPGGKEPHFGALERVHGTAEWKPLGVRRATGPEIRGWLEHDPAANVGVICGQPSGGLVVADVDRPDLARGLSHPATPCVRSSRGWHLYLQAQGRAESRRVRWGELCGEGRYMALPPSVHESGIEYDWRIGLDECDLAPFDALLDDGRPLGAVEDESGPESEVLLTRYAPERDTSTIPVRPADHPRDLPSTGEALARLDPAVTAAMATMGVHAQLGRKFSCILPGHGPDLNPSAAVVRGGDGVWRYFDHHRKADPPTLTLAEVRASRGAGRVVRLDAPSQAQWYRRLFFEAGLLTIALPRLELPKGLSAAARVAAEGYALLLALRELGDGGPAPFTRRFAAAWCGVGEHQAGDAIAELRRARVFRTAGRHGLMNLYVLDECASATARRAA